MFEGYRGERVAELGKTNWWWERRIGVFKRESFDCARDDCRVIKQLEKGRRNDSE